jgi:hypothetical protein
MALLWQRLLGAVRNPLLLILLRAVVLISLAQDVTDKIVIALVMVGAFHARLTPESQC